jgi:hypothetical protein
MLVAQNAPNGTFTVDATNRVIDVRVNVDQNDPAVIERVFAAARREIPHSECNEYHVTIAPRITLDPMYARLSDLRAAFLLGFAALGYSFAIHSNLVQVREQIARPRDQLLPPFWVNFPDAVVAELRLACITKPFDALLVEVRGTQYLLPLPWSPKNFYGEVQLAFGMERPPALIGEELRLPDDLPMVLDFARVRTRPATQ